MNNIEDIELVSVENAELAKRFGYDLLCRYYISNSIRKYSCEGICNNSDTEIIVLPTFTSLQSWFRNKYGIEIFANVNFFNRKEKIGYYYSIDRFVDNIHDGKDYDMDQLSIIGDKKAFETYEDALNTAFKKAFVIIS